MSATFYIISRRVDTEPNSVASAQLRMLVADGDEIARHTVRHRNLPTLSSGDRQREIWNGRVALMNLGFPVTDFAYPFNATAEQLAAACGYNSARGVRGLVTLGSCAGCA